LDSGFFSNASNTSQGQSFAVSTGQGKRNHREMHPEALRPYAKTTGSLTDRPSDSAPQSRELSRSQKQHLDSDSLADQELAG